MGPVILILINLNLLGLIFVYQLFSSFVVKDVLAWTLMLV